VRPTNPAAVLYEEKLGPDEGSATPFSSFPFATIPKHVLSVAGLALKDITAKAIAKVARSIGGAPFAG